MLRLLSRPKLSENMPEEAFYPTSGMLMAGQKCVIATM